jgi:hypothetical protein
MKYAPAEQDNTGSQDDSKRGNKQESGNSRRSERQSLPPEVRHAESPLQPGRLFLAGRVKSG